MSIEYTRARACAVVSGALAFQASPPLWLRGPGGVRGACARVLWPYWSCLHPSRGTAFCPTSLRQAFQPAWAAFSHAVTKPSWRGCVRGGRGEPSEASKGIIVSTQSLGEIVGALGALGCANDDRAWGSNASRRPSSRTSSRACPCRAGSPRHRSPSRSRRDQPRARDAVPEAAHEKRPKPWFVP